MMKTNDRKNGNKLSCFIAHQQDVLRICYFNPMELHYFTHV